jgi:hypothetical protein
LLKYIEAYIEPMNSRRILGFILGIVVVAVLLLYYIYYGVTSRGVGTSEPEAPLAISGDNVYVAWWNNKTANNNEEIMFRASTDGGTTFGDEMYLSNTTNADSWRVEVTGEGPNVLISMLGEGPNAGQTFGPMLMLATNETIGESTEEEGETEDGE